MMQTSTPSSPAASLGDRCAIGLSGLCLVHCLGLPMALSLAPAAFVWGEAEWVHGVLFLLALPVSLWTLAGSSDRSWPLLGLAGLGLALLAAGAAGFPSHDMETPVTVTGALLLAAAHGLNWRRRTPACHRPEA